MSHTPRITRRSALATPLHRAMEAVIKPAFRKHGIAEARLITEWPQIAGAVLADKSLPKRVVFVRGQRDNGTLHLTVAPGWALEVQHLEPLLLEKIATYFGYRAVAKIHITQAPLPPKDTPKKKPPAPALDTGSRQTLDSLTSDIEDDELKAALRSLGENMMREHARKNV